MPPRLYRLAHAGARLTEEEMAMICSWTIQARHDIHATSPNDTTDAPGQDGGPLTPLPGDAEAVGGGAAPGWMPSGADKRQQLAITRDRRRNACAVAVSFRRLPPPSPSSPP